MSKLALTAAVTALTIAWPTVGWGSLRASPFENEHGYRGPTQVAAGIGARTEFGLADWSFLLQPEIYFETPAQSLCAQATVFRRWSRG